MPESDPGDTRNDSRKQSRQARRERRRTRTRNLVITAIALVVVVGAVVVATGVVSFGGSDQKQAAGSVRVADNGVVRSTTTTEAGRPCRALTATDPLRLWVGGDSLAGSLGPSLGTITGATGVVQPYFDSRVSSGLSSPNFFDWPAESTTEMARLNPEIVVFIIGTNDYTTPTTDDSWKADYAKRVEAMLQILGSGGRTVYWVGAPILKDDKMDTGAAAVNAVAIGVVAKHKEATYVDARKLFSDTDGKFAMNLPDETGKVVTMRAGDGVHLTTDGGDFLARAVFKQIDAQCKVTAQKVAGQTKQTIQTEGSTQVAPGSRSSGGTVQTTPPYTSAPATTSAPQVTSPPSTAPPATTAPATTVPSPTTPTAPSVQPSPPGGSPSGTATR
jgi:hypothetical protein